MFVPSESSALSGSSESRVCPRFQLSQQHEQGVNAVVWLNGASSAGVAQYAEWQAQNTLAHPYSVLGDNTCYNFAAKAFYGGAYTTQYGVMMVGVPPMKVGAVWDSSPQNAQLYNAVFTGGNAPSSTIDSGQSIGSGK